MKIKTIENVQRPFQSLNLIDGFVDGIYPYVSQDSLSIYCLDEENEVWEKIPSVIDKDRKVVRADVAHFSVFVILSSDFTDLSKAYAYPVPYRPSQGHDKITFTKLSSQAIIKIFSVSGKLVKTLYEDDGDLVYEWSPVENEYGDKVASGVYFY